MKMRDLRYAPTQEEIAAKSTTDLVIIIAMAATSDPVEPLPNLGRALQLAGDELNRRIPKP